MTSSIIEIGVDKSHSNASEQKDHAELTVLETLEKGVYCCSDSSRE